MQATEYSVRAKQSFIASGMQNNFGAITPYRAIHALPSRNRARESRRSELSPATIRGEGLLHDARNLVGTIGLYRDLLSMPGVLKPEHRQYPEELRLLGARSGTLIDHLMQSLFALESAAPVLSPQAGIGGMKALEAMRGDTAKPVSLRRVVERCSGLLSRVANGRAINITYGPAAAVPVRVPEEVIERILVNLVRNAAAAMEAQTSSSDRSAIEAPVDTVAAISILVGSLVNSVGEHKPWPFQRVRLVVEDRGSGMSPQQLKRLLGGTDPRSRGGHGIGFCVVRDLVAASDGEIRMMSEPGIGTRVQIDWPIVAMLEAGNGTSEISEAPLESSPSIGIQTLARSGGFTSKRTADFNKDELIEVAR